MTLRKTIRRSANRLLPVLFNRAGGKCHYCNNQTVMVRDVQHKLIRLRPFHVIYRDEAGNQIKSDYATVDHIVDLDLGGLNDWGNIVLSCALCNHRKNEAKQKNKVFVAGRS